MATASPRNAAPSDAALASVREFFASTAGLSRAEAVPLSREFRRTGRGPNLHSDHEFLAAVSRGSWGPAHDAAARHIRLRARALAVSLAPWGRRTALAKAIEAAALAVLSQADAHHSLPEELCARLTAPYQCGRAAFVPQQRSCA